MTANNSYSVGLPQNHPIQVPIRTMELQVNEWPTLQQYQRDESDEYADKVRKIQFTVASSTFSAIAMMALFCGCLYLGCCRVKRQRRGPTNAKTWGTLTTANGEPPPNFFTQYPYGNPVPYHLQNQCFIHDDGNSPPQVNSGVPRQLPQPYPYVDINGVTNTPQPENRSEDPPSVGGYKPYFPKPMWSAPPESAPPSYQDVQKWNEMEKNESCTIEIQDSSVGATEDLVNKTESHSSTALTMIPEEVGSSNRQNNQTAAVTDKGTSSTSFEPGASSTGTANYGDINNTPYNPHYMGKPSD